MENLVINGETLAASQEGTLVIKQFLLKHYRFRRNILNGKVEFATLPEAVDTADGLSSGFNEAELAFRPLTQEALNSIVIRAKKENIMEKGSPKTEITEYVQSEEVPVFNPILAFLNALPQWDGQNHVAYLLSRLPGINSEQQNFLSIWLRSAVAHWLQMDMLHGNECVPTFIGSQGCGKTTFVRRLLPPHLRQYYLDHLNLSNKFDKEMALSNNLIVNLDELDAIRPSQHAALKQTLSKSKVNGRPIFGRTQEDRLRFASFVATTNNPHPLTDATGSRRYICLSIPQGQMIDNDGEIDYEQLYAQVLYELQEVKAPYWFNNAEVARIQELNQNYMGQTDIAAIIKACFRKPEEGEKAQAMNSAQMLAMIQNEFPSVKATHSMKVHLGLAMKELEYEHSDRGHVAYYKVIPLKVA
jgi:GTPase SAR1 family protein